MHYSYAIFDYIFLAFDSTTKGIKNQLIFNLSGVMFHGEPGWCVSLFKNNFLNH